MVIENHRTLCSQVIDLCQHYQWYGPSGKKTCNPVAPGYYDPNGTWHDPDPSIFDHRCYVDAEGILQSRAITHDPRTGFEFPPATEEQLAATEQALGFSLPPFLCALYTLVANGGFGPAYGLTGIRGGYVFGQDGHYQTLDQCRDNHPNVTYIDLLEYEQIHGQSTGFLLRETLRPAHFLPLCYEGCGTDYCLDADSGRIYLVEWGGYHPDGKVSVEGHPGIWRNEFLINYRRQADSLEEWIERWVNEGFVKNSL